MKRLALLILLIPSVCLADTIVLQTDGSAWYYADGAKTPVVIPSSNVLYPPGQDPNPDPDDPDDPEPPSPTDLSSKVEGWANEIDDPITALLLSKVYAGIGDKIADGTIDHDTDTIDAALNALVEEAIDRTPSKAGKESDWNSFHDDKVAFELFQLLVANDRVLAVNEWQLFCDDVAKGLEAATEGAAISDIFKELIDILVQILMDFLLNWLNDLTVIPSMGGPVYV